MRKWELEVLRDQLLDVWASNVGSLFDFGDFEDMNRPESGTMSGSHVLVKGVNGIGSRKFSVLLVHIVGAATGIISDPDSEVLDLQWALLVDDVQRNNFSGTLLDLSELL